MRRPLPTSLLLALAGSLLGMLSAIGGVQAHDSPACTHPEKAAPVARTNAPVVSAYYPGYNARFLPVDKIPWRMYTHLQYFVAVPGPSPTADLRIDTEENMLLVVAAAKAHKVPISLSIGGWTGSQTFSSLVGDAKNRSSFVETIARTVKKYGLDGIDLDWEYPNEQGIGCNQLHKNDTPNFLLFLKTLRAKLGPGIRLSAAVSMKGFMSSDGKSYLRDASGFAKALDFFTIMAYDVYGASFSKLAGPNAPLYATCSERSQQYSVAQTVSHWTSTGVPAHQLLLGLPAYGYGYTLQRPTLVPTRLSDKSNKTSLLFQPRVQAVPPAGKSAGTAEGSDVCGRPNRAGGQWLFNELVQTGKLSRDQMSGLNGYRRFYDNCTHTPFLFNRATKNLISYDDSFSLMEKTTFAHEHGLGGVEIFDATGDTPDSQLLQSVRKALFLPEAGKKNPAPHGIKDVV